MKRIFTGIYLLLGVCLSYQLQATHIVGAELEYECLNTLNNTYKLTLTLYRDCARGEAPFDDVVTLFLFGDNGEVVLFKDIRVPPATPQIQPETFDACIAVPPQICVEEGIYETTITLPPRKGGYDIAWARCCRNSAINNLAVPLREGVSFLAHVPDPDLAFCNSMPKFENVPPVFLCNDKQFSFDHSAVDIDGDSLTYAITNPFTGLNQQGIGAGNPNFGQVPPRVNPTNNRMGPPPYLNVEFSNGFRFDDPFGSGNFEIDPKTGFIQVTPNRAGIYVYAISVFEWRNGKLLSENKRDFQIHVINCRVQGDPPLISHDLTGLQVDNDTVIVNAREDFCYDVSVRDVNLADRLTAFSVSSAFGNGNFFPPAANFSFGGINPIQGQVCWNVNCAYEGQVIPLVVGARDINDCPNIGNVFDTVWVKVQIPPNTPPVINPDYSGLRLDQDTIIVKAENDLCFPFEIVDGESNPLIPFTVSDIFASDNPPSFTFSGSSPVNGEVCWTPSCDYKDQVVELSFGAREVNVCRTSPPVINSIFVRIEAPENTNPVIQRELAGLSVNNDTIFLNPLEELCYRYDITDVNNTDELKVSAESRILGGGVGATFSTSGTNPVQGELCWTPSCEFAEEVIEIIVKAEDNPVCANIEPVLDTLYVKVRPDISIAPEIQHAFVGGTVSGDTVTLTVGESICYDFTVADQTPFTSVSYEYEFQTFEGTNIALGSADVIQRNDSILGAFCFQSDCSNGGSIYRVIIKGIDGGLCPPFPVAYDTVFIKVETSFLADVGPDITFCDGEGGVQLEVNPVGGEGPYFYNWGCTDPLECGFSNPFVSNPTVNPAYDTQYFVQVTDKNGCTSEIDSINIRISDLPTVDAGPDQQICEGSESAELSAVILNENDVIGPFTFEWFPKEGLSDPFSQNPIASPNTSTIYTVVAKGQGGCSSSATNLDTLSTIEVVVSEAPKVEAGENREICEGDSVELIGFASGGVPNYSFEWFPQAGLENAQSQSPLAKPTESTMYYLRAFSGGCPGELDSIFVNVHEKPEVTPLAKYEMCSYESIQLIGTASSQTGTTFEYLWESLDGIEDIHSDAPTVNPKTNTIYSLTTTSNFGCIGIFEFPVNVLPTPIVNAGDDLLACEGEVLELKANHIFEGGDGINFPDDPDYTWFPSAGLSDAFIKNPLLLPDQTTIFTVRASYGACETEDEIKVDVFSPQDIALSADTTGLCSGDSVTLRITGTTIGAKYTWLPTEGLSHTNGAELKASPQESITYYVEIEDGGCVRKDSVSLAVSQTPQSDFLASPLLGCEDLLVTVTENTQSGTEFWWDFGDGSPIATGFMGEHIYDTPGTYTLTMNAIGATGCKSETASTEVRVTEKASAAFASSPPAGSSMYLPNPMVNFENTSLNAQHYEWDFGDGTHSAEDHPQKIFTEPGEYDVSLIVTDAGGCKDTLALGKYTIIAPEILIPNVFSPNQDGINDEFMVKYIGKENFSMIVYDRWGNELFTEPSNVENGWDGVYPNGKAASEGVYYYLIQIGEKSFKGNVTLLR